MRTSDKTLSSLKTPKLSTEEVTELLGAKKVQFAERIELLMEDYRAKFDKWMRLLRGEFNIVCFGLGSKRCVIAWEYSRGDNIFGEPDLALFQHLAA